MVPPSFILSLSQNFVQSASTMDAMCARRVAKALIKTQQVVTILVDEAGVKKMRLVL